MRIYIGIPMFGGADAEFISSLMKTRLVLDKLGYEVEVDINTGCSVITKARNDIVKRFIDSEFDVLFFVDSDIDWDVIDLVKLLRSNHELSACIYRGKTEDEVYHCVTEETVGEWIKAQSVATGFMAIQRDVILKMQKAYPGTQYEQDGELYHALFDTEVFQRRYWGEDYTFCRRWCAIGGEINVMTDATIKHIGKKAYTGNYAEHMKGKNDVHVAIQRRLGKWCNG